MGERAGSDHPDGLERYEFFAIDAADPPTRSLETVEVDEEWQRSEIDDVRLGYGLPPLRPRVSTESRNGLYELPLRRRIANFVLGRTLERSE